MNLATGTYNLGQAVVIGPSAVNDDGLEHRDANGDLANADGDVLTVWAPDGTSEVIDTDTASTGVYFSDPVDGDQTGVWFWHWVFTTDLIDSVATGQFVVEPIVTSRPAFAYPSDVAARLGRALTAEETGQIVALLALTTACITEAVGRNDAWAAAYVVPASMRALTVEVAARLLTVPLGARSTQEQLGSYLYSATYPASRDGVTYGSGLSEDEARRARRIVYGTNVASVPLGSLLSDFFEPEVTDVE